MDDSAVVELIVPADPSFVSLLRTATTAVCAQADLTVEALDDLALAVTEACALVSADAPEDASIQLRLQVSGKDVSIDLQCPTVSGAPVPPNTFSWTVLTALVDTVDTDVTDGCVHIRMQASGIAA